VTALFASRYGADVVTERFDIPMDYTSFMVRVGGGHAWGDEYVPQCLWDATTVAEETEADWRRYVTERGDVFWLEKEQDAPTDYGCWLDIGWYSDKHATLLCCDRLSEGYGRVFDFHDAHPWLNGDEYGHVEGRSFSEWLAIQAAKDSPQQRGWFSTPSPWDWGSWLQRWVVR
jgi:hypothetical protein